MGVYLCVSVCLHACTRVSLCVPVLPLCVPVALFLCGCDLLLRVAVDRYVCLGIATRDTSTAVHLGGDKYGCV